MISTPLLIIAFTLMAAAYITKQPEKYFGHALIKAAPILLLAAVLFFSNSFQLPSMVKYLLLGSLLFSAAGDIFLALDEDDSLFVWGLGSFFIAHVIYGINFLQSTGFQTAAIVPIVIILLLGIVLTTKIWPGLGELKIPVLAYILVSVFMGIAAAIHAPLNWLLIAGTIVFMLSDSVIAVEKFWRSVPYRDFWVMSTYYLAQILIFLALTHEMIV